MAITPRKRASSNPELERAKQYVMKPKLHKLSIWVPLEDYRKMEIKGIQNNEKVTPIIRRLIKDFINN